MGRVNDPLYDTVTIDANGNIIDGSGEQIKFLGAKATDPTGAGNAQRAFEKLQSKKFGKYLDADAKITVPSDQYDEIMQLSQEKLDSLSQQMERAQQEGKADVVKAKQAQIDKINKIRKNLRKSKVSSKEAEFARLHPKLSTAQDVVKLSHRAGMQGAKMGAAIGGSISVIKNLVSVCKGEVEPGEAVLNVAKETGTAAATGYATQFAGTALKGAMQNSGCATVRTLAKSNIAAQIVSITVSTSRTLKKYLDGDIDGVQCLEELGESGASMIASSVTAAIGQAVIPIPIVGAMVGSMVGYALSSAAYGTLLEASKDAKLAHEERLQVEKACAEHIAMIRECRREMEQIINTYLADTRHMFEDSFSGIKNALAIGDVDWFIESANNITESFGGTAQFSNMEEFDDFMLSDVPLKL